ncbi:MAG: SpoIIE family protein phosphatase [Firmicutes bacterium]|nr:SpoIIE family protein phosphatase [Bacillota bacterium]
MKKPKQRIAFKIISGIVVLIIIFSVIVNYISYHEFTNNLLSQYADGAFRTAETAALDIDPDRMEEYAKSGGVTEEYMAAWNRMDQLCNSSGSTFIYVIQPDLTDYNHITFLFSTIDHDSTYTIYDFGYYRETTNDDYKAKYRRLYEGESEQELVIRDKGYIETDPHITAMIPLKGSDGETKAILCVQRQMDILSLARKSYIKKVTMVFILFALIVIAGQSLYLHFMLLNPVKKITNEAARFAQENVKAGEKLTDVIRNKDEIGLLAGSVDQMEEQIENYVDNLEKITAEKEKIGAELSLATNIQAAMLPNTFPPFPDLHEFDIYASMNPAKEVGGDFYDYFLIDDDHLYMAIADVSGKGIPAALFMMASQIIFGNHAMLGKSPAEILMGANNVICSHNKAEMFVTAWVGILEISTGKLVAANAGHEYPAVMSPEGKFEILKDKHGFVIGGMKGIKYNEYEIQLEPGSKIFLYTDGVPEATDSDKKMFGLDRMIDALNKEPNTSPEGVLNNVKKAVKEFVQEAEQFDDVTMLCLEYNGNQQDLGYSFFN